MVIDEEVAEGVRDVLYALVTKDLPGTRACLEALADDDADAITLLNQLLRVSLVDVAARRRMTPEEVRTLAEQVVVQETFWANAPSVESFEAVMLSAAGFPSARSAHPAQAEDVLIIMFITMAHVLTHDPSGQPWLLSLQMREEAVRRYL